MRSRYDDNHFAFESLGDRIQINSPFLITGLNNIIYNDLGANTDVEVAPGASVIFASSQHLSSLTIDSGSNALMDAAGGFTMSLGALTIAPTTAATGSGGLLDIGRSFVYVNDSSSSTFQSIQQYWSKGYNLNGPANPSAGIVGDWAGRGGITSTFASASTPDGSYITLGAYDSAFAAANNIALGVGANTTSNSTSQSILSPNVPANTTLIRATLTGDTNGDGVVNAYDVAAVNAHYNNAPGAPLNNNGSIVGDFTGDGHVNSGDVTIFNNAGNYSPQAPAALQPLVRSVPIVTSAGSQFSGHVANFIPSVPAAAGSTVTNNAATDYYATINWGDGAVDSNNPAVTTTANPVTLSFDPSDDTYYVDGTHTYTGVPASPPSESIIHKPSSLAGSRNGLIRIAPVGLNSTTTGTSVDLSWNGNAPSYQIYRWQGANAPASIGTVTPTGTALAGSTPNTYHDAAGLQPDNGYFYRVIASYGNSVTTQSDLATATSSVTLTPVAASVTATNGAATIQASTNYLGTLDATRVSIDWADGNVTTAFTSGITSPNQFITASHTYAITGNYTAVMSVTDAAGVSQSAPFAVATTGLASSTPQIGTGSAQQNTNSTWTLTGSATSPVSAALVYEWSLNNEPDNAPDPLITTDPATGIATVQFYQAGTYTFSLTASNQIGGASATSAVVQVAVTSEATTVQTLDSNPQVQPGHTYQLNAVVLDQFGNKMSRPSDAYLTAHPTAPYNFVWTYTATDGSVSSTGLYTAPAGAPTETVTVTAHANGFYNDSVSGSSGNDLVYVTSTASVPTTVPAAPTSVVATPNSDGSVTVNWNGNANTDEYIISASNDGGVSYTSKNVYSPGQAASGLQVLLPVSVLVGNASYTFRIVPINGAGSGPAATSSSTTTQSPIGTIVTAFSKAKPISKLTPYTPTPYSLSYAWAGSGTPGATYNIYISTSATLPRTALPNATTPLTNYISSPLTPSTTYKIWIAAVAPHHPESKRIGPITMTTLAAPPVTQPLPATNVTAAAVQDFNGTESAAQTDLAQWFNGAKTLVPSYVDFRTHVNVAWNASPTLGVSYNVYRVQTPPSTPALVLVGILPVGVTSFVDFNAPPNTNNSYLVKASFLSVESPSSNISSNVVQPKLINFIDGLDPGFGKGTYAYNASDGTYAYTKSAPQYRNDLAGFLPNAVAQQISSFDIREYIFADLNIQTDIPAYSSKLNIVGYSFGGEKAVQVATAFKPTVANPIGRTVDYLALVDPVPQTWPGGYPDTYDLTTFVIPSNVTKAFDWYDARIDYNSVQATGNGVVSSFYDANGNQTVVTFKVTVSSDVSNVSAGINNINGDHIKLRGTTSATSFYNCYADVTAVDRVGKVLTCVTYLTGNVSPANQTGPILFTHKVDFVPSSGMDKQITGQFESNSGIGKAIASIANGGGDVQSTDHGSQLYDKTGGNVIDVPNLIRGAIV